MNQVIDLAGDDKSADAAAMVIDAINYLEQSTAPIHDPDSGTAAPALFVASQWPTAAAAPPVAGIGPAPANGLDAAANDALRQSQREKRPSRQRMIMDQIGEQPQHLKMNRRNGKISLQEMQTHLETVSIGLRPSDPTVTELPDELPPPIHPANSTFATSAVEIINLAEWTQESLNALAATTAPKDPFNALLQEPPSAPKDRLGRFTGQQRREKIIQNAQPPQPAYLNISNVPVERKREKKVVSVAAPPPLPTAAAHVAAHQGGKDAAPLVHEDMMNTVHKCLSVGVDVSWSLLGRKMPMVTGGVDIPVLALWRAVQSRGGFGEVSNRKLWNAVGRELGFDTRTFRRVYVVRETYAKYLLPYEVFLRHKREEEERTIG